MKKRVLKTAVFLAFKDAFKNKGTVILVLVSLAFSFVNLLFAPSIIKGFGKTFQDEITNINGQIIIIPKEGKTYLDNPKEIERKINQVEGIKGEMYHLNTGVTIAYKGKVVGAFLNGISVSDESKVSIVPESVVSGKFISANDSKEIILGKDMADRLKKSSEDGIRIKVGEKVKIIFGNGLTKTYRIKGIVDNKNFAANNYVFINRTEIENNLKIKDKASEIYIKLKNPDKINSVKNKLKKLNLNGDVTTWEDRAGSIKEIMKGIDKIRQVLSGVGIIISGVIIAVIIYVNSESKKRQIGILKAIGATNLTILIMFLFQSFIFASLGVIFGSGIFAIINYYLTQNPIKLPFGYLSPVAESSLVKTYVTAFFMTAVLSALYPAWRASKGVIIKAIWGE
ncbi:MAG: ABC transporter permease [Actinobacteria bacterium]|nr:ABC transporter permease [Actinomycetota bacterium]